MLGTTFFNITIGADETWTIDYISMDGKLLPLDEKHELGKMFSLHTADGNLIWILNDTLPLDREYFYSLFVSY